MRFVTIAAFIIISAISNSVFAKTYYVKSNGNDAANGLSHATAWKSVNKVNSFAFQTGDDVYFLAGNVWNKQLTPNWSGTASNRAIVGSYYMSNGKETIGVPANTAKPTFNGTYKQAGDSLNTPDAVPSNLYSALIHVSGNYVTIQNLRAINSAGLGITLAPRNNYHHAIFENNEVDGTAITSMTFGRTTYSNTMRNNRMRKCDLAWINKDITTTWPMCNGAVGSRDNLIEGNYISESYGEGIVAFEPSAVNNVIRNNILVAVRSSAIYIDNASNNLIENNIVIGEEAPSTYSMVTGRRNGAGLNIAVEDYPNSKGATGNIFRNNFVANVHNCISIGLDTASKEKGLKVGGKFIGNTCVNNKVDVNSWATNTNVESIEIANNIFLDAVDGQNACKTPTNMKFHHNYWNQTQSSAHCNGTGDVRGGLALTKTSGWGTLTIANIPTVNDFTPTAGSPVLNKGIAHNDLVKDYFGDQRTSRPDMGAVEVSAKNIVTIPTPTGLSLSIN